MTSQLAAVTATEIERATGIFQRMPSIPRLFRDVIVTEKVDGTNSSIFITEDGQRMYTASRNRWITPDDDNYDFAKWAAAHGEELLQLLGPGHHFGEWYGSGIQRGYGMRDGNKRFALFNVQRWASPRNKEIFPEITEKATLVPSFVDVVPILAFGPFDTHGIWHVGEELKRRGSEIAPGFDRPEGIVVYHKHADALFKYTFDKNDGHKSTGLTK